MEEIVARYYALKQAQKEIEEELDSLRKIVLQSYQQPTKVEFGAYEMKVMHQERREYDEHKLYAVLPESSMWRMVSKADSGKIASLIKVGVLNEMMLHDTYHTKTIPYIQVTKR